jgi:hypothetical protein
MKRPIGPLSRALEQIETIVEHLAGNRPETREIVKVLDYHLMQIAAFTALDPSVRPRIQEDPTYVFHDALDEALQTGDGWIRLTRDEEGRIHMSHVHSSMITVRGDTR